MIIEYLGVSGAGKTTNAKKMYDDMSKRGELVEYARFELYERRSWFYRNCIKSVLVIRVALFNIKWVGSAHQILRTLKLSKRDLLTLLFNYCALKSLLDKCNCSKKKYIFDEGVYQIIWATYLRTNIEPSKEIVIPILNMFKIQSKLIVVNADTDLIIERLHKRNIRTKILEYSDLSQKIQAMKNVQNSIIKCASESDIYRACDTIYLENN